MEMGSTKDTEPMKIPIRPEMAVPPVKPLGGDSQHRPQRDSTSSDGVLEPILSQPAPQPASQPAADDGSVPNPHASFAPAFPPAMPPMGAMHPMGLPMMPPMPMFSHEYTAIAQQFSQLAQQAQCREHLAGIAPEMPPNLSMFPPVMPNMPPYMWAPPYYGNMPPGVNPDHPDGFYGKGRKKGKGDDKRIYNVGQGRGQGGKNAAMQQANTSAQFTLANQNNAAAPKRAAGPQAFAWSAPVYEKHENEMTYTDGIIFQAALDKKGLRPEIGTEDKKLEQLEIGTDSWMKYYGALKDLDFNKLTVQDGREMTYEELCQVRETSKKTQSKSAPEGSLSKEQQQAKLKICRSGGDPVELSFEDMTLLRCQLRMQDGKEMMSVPEFFSLDENERKARLPVRVQVPQCGEQALKTTVMIRNLPNMYERGDVKELLDEKGFLGKYDFVYVPADYKHDTGLGYAFVNMGNEKDHPGKNKNEVFHGWAVEVWEKLHGFKGWKQKWSKKEEKWKTSSKDCEVTWGSSEHQGKQHHIDRYRDSPVMHSGNPPSYKPAIYGDDGEMKTFPEPKKALRKPRTKKQPRTGCTSPDRSKAEDGGKDKDAGLVLDGKGIDTGSGGGPGDGKT